MISILARPDRKGNFNLITELPLRYKSTFTVKQACPGGVIRVRHASTRGPLLRYNYVCRRGAACLATCITHGLERFYAGFAGKEASRCSQWCWRDF